MPYTHIYFLPNIFLSYVVAILRKYPCENYSSKVAGCRWTVGGWTVFQRLWLHISSPFSKIPIFHAKVSFMKLCSFMKKSRIFRKFEKKVFDFNLLFIWMKNLLVEDCYYHRKRLLTGKVSIFQIKKCFLSLSLETLKNTHERILVLG